MNHIRGLIEAGELQPGDSLPSERELVKQFGISRFSLREGLARLDALGIISVRHGKGSVVSGEVSKRSISDVFLPLLGNANTAVYQNLIDARIVVEKATAAAAAAQRTAKDIAKLERILSKAELELDNAQRFGELDAEFHNTIAGIGGNAFLFEMLHMLHSYVRAFILENVRDRTTREQAHEDHLEILDCIRHGYTNKVEDVMHRHIVTCKTRYEDHHRPRS